MPAYADDTLTAQSTFEGLKKRGIARVDTVIDPLTIIMKDGKIIRLPSLDIPELVYPEPGYISVKSKNELEKLLPPGTEVILYQKLNAKNDNQNSMGHIFAHLETKNGKIWVNGHLIQNGLARVAPSQTHNLLSDEMYKLEQNAREKEQNIWDENAYPILNVADAPTAKGQFAIIEGTINSITSINNNVYWHFVSDKRNGFYVLIKPKVRKLLSRTGINPLSLQGHKIRIRGVVHEENGAFIELIHPAVLELPELPEDDESSKLAPN